MTRMWWVTMGMYVPFVAPSLTPRRCPCMASVSCNIVQIALTRVHVTISVLGLSNFGMLCTQGAHSDFALSGQLNKKKDMCC